MHLLCNESIEIADDNSHGCFDASRPNMDDANDHFK